MYNLLLQYIFHYGYVHDLLVAIKNILCPYLNALFMTIPYIECSQVCGYLLKQKKEYLTSSLIGNVAVSVVWTEPKSILRTFYYVIWKVKKMLLNSMLNICDGNFCISNSY